jgi:hypothetical protein
LPVVYSSDQTQCRLISGFPINFDHGLAAALASVRFISTPAGEAAHEWVFIGDP